MIPDILFDALSTAARAAVFEAWLEAHRFVAPSPPIEVDHIYAMTTKGVERLGAYWTPILNSAGISVRITGVFCHQTPYADYTHPVDGNVSPELGDLLLVYEHKNTISSGKTLILRRAVFVQTKMTEDGVPKTVDEHQEYLYENWPDFELRGVGRTRSIRFQKGPRIFRPGTDAGRYGLIDRDPRFATSPRPARYPPYFPWAFAEPRKPIRTAGAEDAGAFIANMLYDTSWSRGRAAEIPSPVTLNSVLPNNHFDVTVEEMLTVTANKLLRYPKRSHIKGPRGYPVIAGFQLASGSTSLLPSTGALFATSDDDGAITPPKDPDDGDDESCMPVLLIETGSEGHLRG